MAALGDPCTPHILSCTPKSSLFPFQCGGCSRWLRWGWVLPGPCTPGGPSTRMYPRNISVHPKTFCAPQNPLLIPNTSHAMPASPRRTSCGCTGPVCAPPWVLLHPCTPGTPPKPSLQPKPPLSAPKPHYAPQTPPFTASSPHAIPAFPQSILPFHGCCLHPTWVLLRPTTPGTPPVPSKSVHPETPSIHPKTHSGAQFPLRHACIPTQSILPLHGCYLHPAWVPSSPRPVPTSPLASPPPFHRRRGHGHPAGGRGRAA